MLGLSSGNVTKYYFLTEKHVLPEKDLLENAAKAFEYLPLGNELKKQTRMSRKTVQKIRQHL